MAAGTAAALLALFRRILIARATPVAPAFFGAMGIRLVEGRSFTRADADPDRFLVVINETLARRFWPGESAIGKRLKHGWPEDEGPLNPWREIIGVVADVNDEGLESEAPLQVYTNSPRIPGATWS